MVLVCENCHPKSSIALIHGEAEDKKGCYLCHGGTSKSAGSEIPHMIHESKVDCKECHQENGQVVVPKCEKCHDVDKLHAFDKIGKLTAQNGLNCPACHADETKLSSPQTTPVQVENTHVPTVLTTVQVAQIEATPQSPNEEPPVRLPGFEAIFAIGLMMAGYMIRKDR